LPSPAAQPRGAGRRRGPQHRRSSSVPSTASWPANRP